MKRFFQLYQYIGPLILTPLAAVLWWRHYDGNVPLTALALAVPIVHAYVVPGIGTNVLKMWAFNTRLRLGRFRPHHGFVFGSATAILTLPLVGAPDPAPSGAAVMATALLVGGVLLVVNWIYDALALKSGVLEVYNQPWAEGAGPWAIAGDYVVWFFGVFGLIYGAGLKLAEGRLLANPDPIEAATFGVLLVGSTVTVPSLLYIAASRLRHGHTGCRPVTRPPSPATREKVPCECRADEGGGEALNLRELALPGPPSSDPLRGPPSPASREKGRCGGLSWEVTPR